MSALLRAGGAAPAADLEKRLKTPLSPGAVALLGPFATQPAVVGRLAEALRDPRPETRAAAARVVTVTSLRDLQKSVEDALAEESDAEAAREEIRALVAVAAPADDERWIAATDRFEGRLDPDLAEILARQRGRGAMPLLLSARRWHLTPSEWAHAVWLAARGDGEALVPALSRALGTGNRERWDELLRLLVRRKTAAGRNVAAVGLRSSHPCMAARSAWYLAWIRQTEPLPEDRALIPQWDPPEGADPETVYLIDLVHRTFGEPAADSNTWIETLGTAKSCVADDIGPGSPWLDLMTPAERNALRRRSERLLITVNGKAAKSQPGWDGAAKRPSSKTDYGFRLRTVSGLPRGVPADALKVGDCRPRRGQIIGVVAVVYGPDGRPREVRPYDTTASDACDAVGLALTMMALSRDDEFPIGNAPVVLVGVTRADCLTALEEREVCPSVCPEERDDVVHVGGTVKPPVLEDRVEPIYHESLRRAGKQGVVTLEAVIGTDGCVQDVKVEGPADPGLDVEAARAVSQWKYRPAMLDGRPVRVWLTVTVTYRLN